MYGTQSSPQDYGQMPHVIARREATRSRLRKVLVPLVIVGLVAFGLYERERRIAAEYRALPEAPAPPLETEADLAALTERLEELEKLIERHPLSPMGFIAARERAPLQREVDQLEAVTSEQRRQLEATIGDEDRMADSYRVRGLDAAHLNDMRSALDYFTRSLEVCTDEWAHREQVLRDATAIRELLAQADQQQKEQQAAREGDPRGAPAETAPADGGSTAPQDGEVADEPTPGQPGRDGAKEAGA